jgi:TatD DNase family protein
MTLIDTHSHIYLSEFNHDKEQMLQRAEKEGVGYVLMPAIDRESHSALLELEKNNPHCKAMMGVHPCSVKANYEEELAAARQYLNSRTFVAVGEIGLDFYWDKTFLTEQYAAFHEQLEWALHFDVPVSIHSRNATDECLTVVAKHQNGNLEGVFHCFSGDVVQAKKAVDLGFYLGIGGVVTFKNSGLDKVMEEVSLEHIVLETDAPYLAPVPFRGKRNEPAYLRYVVEKLAEIKKTTVEEIALVTTANAKNLFGT